MRRASLSLAGLVGVLATLAVPSRAHADKADKLFQKAKKLQGEKKYAEACPLFEEVDKTDPGIGAKLNVGKCYEDWGRLATAYRWYVAAEKSATATKDDRAGKIKDLIADLDANVPRMTIKVPEGADPDVLDTLTLDGAPIAADFLNSEQRVDPGPHVIEYVVDGAKKKKMAPVERGGESELSLDIPKGTGKKPRPPKKRPDVGDGGDGGGGGETRVPPPVIVAPADPGKTRRRVGVVVGSVGVAAVGVASVLTLTARSKYKDALSAHCMGSTSMCDDIGLRDTHDARSRANLATVVTLGGVVAIGTGVILYLTAPKASAASAESATEARAWYVTPAVDASGAGVVLGGAF